MPPNTQLQAVADSLDSIFDLGDDNEYALPIPEPYIIAGQDSHNDVVILEAPTATKEELLGAIVRELTLAPREKAMLWKFMTGDADYQNACLYGTLLASQAHMRKVELAMGEIWQIPTELLSPLRLLAKEHIFNPQVAVYNPSSDELVG